MAAAALSIKLRCASWQQLATIYRRDLSRGAMFLKAATQPPIGTVVRIDLELPSATVIELSGTIVKHVVDPQRGTGVELRLDPLPTRSVWLIESALAAETKVRAASSSGVPEETQSAPPSGPVRAITEGEDVAAAETELVRALEAEVESLRKLNPFLVLGVGYEASDADVRAAFGELTKRYHPDRFARYQSVQLRQVAAELFILIRDAYRKLADSASRAQVLASIGPKAPPVRAPSQPRAQVVTTSRIPVQGVPPSPARVAVPPIPAPPQRASTAPTTPMPPGPLPAAAAEEAPGPHDAPTNPSTKPAQLATTELARADHLAIPKSGPIRTIPAAPAPAAPAGDPTDTSALDELLDEGRLDEALAGFRVLAKKHPQERALRAGIELCEGLRALAARDRLEAAQRFESALELDPTNERAARELAEMRRQATNERKGLLSRLMGKKEPPT